MGEVWRSFAEATEASQASKRARQEMMERRMDVTVDVSETKVDLVEQTTVYGGILGVREEIVDSFGGKGRVAKRLGNGHR